MTTLGAFLDLTADKVLVAALLIALVEVGLAAAWLVIVILVREFVVGGIRQVAASEQLLVGSQLVGKAKTVITLIGIGALLLAFDVQTGGPTPVDLGLAGQVVGTWLLVAGMALALVSGIDYVAKAWPLRAATTGPMTSFAARRRRAMTMATEPKMPRYRTWTSIVQSTTPVVRPRKLAVVQRVSWTMTCSHSG